jgi:hypothetical protein
MNGSTRRMLSSSSIRKVREADGGTKGKLAGDRQAPGCWWKSAASSSPSRTSLLGRISVCVPRDLALAAGDRLHLKANRKLLPAIASPMANWSP